MTPNGLGAWIIEQAKSLGFADAGVTVAYSPPKTFPHFEQWLAEGRHGTMAYLARGKDRREQPSLLLPKVDSMVVVAMPYRASDPPPHIRDDPSRGRIARYAWGDDYHETMLPLLKELGKILDGKAGSKSMAYVDTGAILERDAATQAGLGIIGKNTNLISPKAGSYILLGVLLTTASLTLFRTEMEPPMEISCGRCITCLHRCPTHALYKAFHQDARLCISYQTIENRAEIPVSLRPKMKNWIYGCDECQSSCPHNREVVAAESEQAKQEWERWTPPLLSLVEMTEQQFLERFAGTPILRTKRSGLLRNVANALTNWGAPQAVDALKLLAKDAEPLVSDHAKWGLQKLAKAST